MDVPETVSLRDYFDTKFKAIEDHTQLRFDALDKALKLAALDAKEKYGNLNQLRGEVITDRGLLVPKTSCDAIHKEIHIWRDLVNNKLTTLETRSITWTAAVGLFFLLINMVQHFWK